MAHKFGARWLAVKLLEQDDVITAKIQSREVLDVVTACIEHLKGIFRDEPEVIMADRRYGIIAPQLQRHDRCDSYQSYFRAADLSNIDVFDFFSDV